MGDILDAIFGAAVLMVGVDAAEGESLAGFGDRIAKGQGVKETIVGVVVTDGDAVRGSKAFEGKLGSDSGGLVEFRHEVHVCEVGEMVNEDGGAGVAKGGGSAAMSGNKSWGGADELVDADNLTGEGGRLDGAEIAGAFGTPRFAMGFAVGAARAGRRTDVGEFGWNQASSGKELETGEAKVTEPFVVDEEEVLLALGGDNGRVIRRKIGGGCVGRGGSRIGSSWGEVEDGVGR